MDIKKRTIGSRVKGKTKRKYIRPEIKEVWNENIGMTGVYLLEM